MQKMYIPDVANLLANQRMTFFDLMGIDEKRF